MPKKHESIFEYVKARLAATEVPLTQIAAETDVKPRWLTTLRNGKIKEPSVVKIEKLAAYFRESEAA